MDAPRKILLATDLSARSDRAFDRALLLARPSGAELVILHVIEPHDPNREVAHARPRADLEALARRRLVSDLGPAADQARIRIERGDPADLIPRIAREEGSTLIVTGVARNERLGRFTLGATVDRLLRATAIPLLIVTERARAPYQHIFVALDFSMASARALELASAMFPDQPLTAFHTYEASADYAASDLDKHRLQYRLVARATYDSFLTTSQVSPETRRRLTPHLVWGDPEQVLLELAEHDAIDLVVLGSRARGRLSALFVGSVARRILTKLPCDALIVRKTSP